MTGCGEKILRLRLRMTNEGAPLAGAERRFFGAKLLRMTGGGVFMTLAEKALAYNREIKEALETVYGALNEGQKKKILKNAKVKALFDRYKINCEGSV